MDKVTGFVTGVNGNLVSASFSGSVRKNEVGYVLVGDERLKGEVIRINGDTASMQIYEMTNGIQVGDKVELSGQLMSVELGPGLLTQVFDGLQNPLPKLAEKCGFFLERGVYLDPIPDRDWEFTPRVAPGDVVTAGDAIGSVPEGLFTHLIMVPFDLTDEWTVKSIRLETKRFCREHGYSSYDIREHRGLMRNLVVRTSSTGEVMVIVVFGEEDRARIGALLDHLKERFPEITSLMYMVNTKLNDSTGDIDAHLWSGRDHIFEEMEGLRFKIGPKSFYQTNSAQAYELYKVARSFAGLTGGETLYDLYTGTGTIANFVARTCRQVVGIEYVPEAIEDAKCNSRLNGIDNTAFFAGDMKDVLDDAFIARHGRPDVVTPAPPRAGVHEEVLETIKRAAPQRIVYVSCNPATQARDLALLAPLYRVTAVQPVDMFPHTHHVENVVRLDRNTD